MVHEHTYICDGNPKNLAPGYCILLFHDAVQQCGRDPECGGFETCTNVIWHHSFDRDGLPAVQLFRKGSATIVNWEWSSYIKVDYK